MMTDDMDVLAESMRLGFVLAKHGCRPLDDRQAEALAKYVLEYQMKIDDLSDKRDGQK